MNCELSDLDWLRDVIAEPPAWAGASLFVDIHENPDLMRAVCRIAHHAGFRPVFVATGGGEFDYDDIRDLAGEWWPQYERGLRAFNDGGEATYAIRDMVRAAEINLGARLRARLEGE